ncbi:MAG TPA: hypothetical protein VMV92_28665 [Streptosporangiaceae bacterium]|nr:hypothetical protein [Streptosporangiaceae bacterium]
MRDRGGGRSRQARDRPPSWSASDRARASEPARESRLDRDRDRDRIQELATGLQAMERDHPAWGHTFREHVDVTDEQLGRRAAKGMNTRGRQEPLPPAHATRWQSKEAMAVAAYALRHSDEYRHHLAAAEKSAKSRFRTQRPLAEVLGPAWRTDVYGHSNESHGQLPSQWRPDSQAVAIWQKQDNGRWHLYTCYPEVGC